MHQRPVGVQLQPVAVDNVVLVTGAAFAILGNGLERDGIEGPVRVAAIDTKQTRGDDDLLRTRVGRQCQRAIRSGQRHACLPDRVVHDQAVRSLSIDVRNDDWPQRHRSFLVDRRPVRLTDVDHRRVLNRLYRDIHRRSGRKRRGHRRVRVPHRRQHVRVPQIVDRDRQNVRNHIPRRGVPRVVVRIWQVHHVSIDAVQQVVQSRHRATQTQRGISAKDVSLDRRQVRRRRRTTIDPNLRQTHIASARLALKIPNEQISTTHGDVREVRQRATLVPDLSGNRLRVRTTEQVRFAQIIRIALDRPPQRLVVHRVCHPRCAARHAAVAGEPQIEALRTVILQAVDVVVPDL